MTVLAEPSEEGGKIEFELTSLRRDHLTVEGKKVIEYGNSKNYKFYPS